MNSSLQPGRVVEGFFARVRPTRPAFQFHRGVGFVLFAVLFALSAAQTNFAVRRVNTTGGTLRAFATNGSVMVVAGDTGLILSSPDGATWTRRTSNTNETLHAAAFGGGQFVIVGDRGTILRSADGREWTSAASPGTNDHLYAVTYGRARFVAAGDYGIVLTSSDSDQWSESRRFILTPWRAVLYAGGNFVATGETGIVYASYDGEIWSNRFSSTTKELQAMAYGPSGFVTVGEAGAVQFGGSNGFSWSGYGFLTGTTERLRGACAGANVVLAAGDGGTVVVSTAPYAWSALTTPTSANLHAVGFSHDTFVVVGERETILQSEPVFSHALRNLSVRAEVGPGERTLIVGFAIRGVAPKRLLIRAGGPSLAQFGVAAPLARPSLTIHDGTGRTIATNTGWSTSPDPEALRMAARQSGAYAFADGSDDCAVVVTLAPGIYTAAILVQAAETGVALLECYDLDPVAESKSRLTNLSARAFVGSGENAVIPGLSIGSSRKLLVRAVGPGLVGFGVSGALTAARFRLLIPGWATFLIGGPVIMPPSAGPWFLNWNASLGYAHALTPDDIREAAARTGAFPLAEQSNDAAALLLLGGEYPPRSLEVRSADNNSGIVLVEIYDVTDP